MVDAPAHQPRRVHVVPHTHWDREWYKPFPVFRMQLVELLDGLLPQLEADASFAHFQLDGQLAVVDDYLEIRPAERDRLVALNEAGRLSFGPWYTLPDEFLVSGETLVRDLQLGMATAERFGGSMLVGYLPDMFGHVAQMPQVLAGFGLHDAVVWRGVPSAIDAPAFWWEAPDGTRVRAEYLADGYSNGARLPDGGKELVEQLDDFVAAQGARAGDPLLWMNGTDHLLPQPQLGRVVAEANETQAGYEVVVTSLAEHLAATPSDGLPVWRGELRSGARTNLLMGVASCRVDVKQAAARAERWLERVAEPLATCWQPADAHPLAFLDHAWRDVVRNAAHDSICGCSADEVNDAVLHRYAEAARVAEAIAERAIVRVLAASGQAAVAINPSPRPRAGIAELILAGEEPPPGAQLLSARPARERLVTLDRTSGVPVVLRAVLEDPKVRRAEVAEQADGTVLALLHADGGPRAVDATALREQLEDLAAADPDGTLHLEVQRARATQKVLVRTPEVPGYGWRGLAPTDLGDGAVRATDDGLGLANGHVAVVVDPSDGTFSIDGHAGLGRIVDDGDAGDTYNWSPPSGDRVVDQPDQVEVRVVEAGPVRGRIEVVRTYRWPERVAGDARVGEVPTRVTTRLELRAGEDLVRVRVRFDNRSEDHRVRMWFPLPEAADHSEAECAFGTVRRGLVAEGGPNEVGLPTFPSRRFVAAGGLLVAHDGLSEYELVDVAGEGDDARAGALAVTLLRCVGLISNGPMAMRALPAGPPLPTPAAQMPGAHEAELVLHLGGRDPYAVADEAFAPLLVGRYPGRDGTGDLDAVGQALHVEGAEVSALRRRADGRTEVRVVNTTDAEAAVRIEGRTGELTDLLGRPSGERFEGELALRPHQIQTIALD
ncbi:MAG: glycoside hydrolase family 38 C-terminal domain-containing protein [Acidimicrobiales bacterium]